MRVKLDPSLRQEVMYSFGENDFVCVCMVTVGVTGCAVAGFPNLRCRSTACTITRSGNPLLRALGYSDG